jgi:hypothetical protein
MSDRNQFPDYLGDGVYCHFDGYQIWLTTQQGMEIALEPSVMDALKRYEARIVALLAEQRA